ncbi:MAG: pitrilysin family protein [Proteobacteria bacterium]|jgi:zinc protease|nr:pitrilysin family protein [Pseudomonadota bacterium]
MIHEFLENGVEVVLKENRFTPAVAIQIWVGVGSMHEQSEERGMAHFLEHMLFKGTEKRAVGEIAATVEACGGDINAYTTFDQTVYHLTLAAEHAHLGVDLLCDAFSSSRLELVEFQREREVILEEIRRSNDGPGSILGRRVFELMFAGSEAGRPIIGSEASVSGFLRDDLEQFYQRWYTPQNVTVVAVGDFDELEMLSQIKATFGCIAKNSTMARQSLRLPERPESCLEWPRVSIKRGDYQQPRLAVVYPAPSLENVDSTALDVAAFALGAGEMSRLNQRLRDDEAVVTNASASVYSPLFGGLFEISALMPLESILSATAAIGREVARLSGVEPVTGDELSRARANLKADRIYQEETVDGQARALGFGLRTAQKLVYDEVYTAMINHMPETAVIGAARRWLRPEDAAVVVLVPNDFELTEAELRTCFRRGVLAGASEGSVAVSTPAAKSLGARAKDTEVIDLSDGVRLIHRRNPNVDLFTLTAATEGGLRAETAANAGLYNAVFSMLGMASESRDYVSLVTEVEGLGASLEGFSGKDSAGIHMQCLTEQTERMLELLREVFLTPAFPEAQWVSTKREIEQGLLAQNDSPSSICIRRFQEQLYGDHPYRHPISGTVDSVRGFTTELLSEAYRSLRDSGPWVFSVAANLPTAKVEALVRSALKGFSPAAKGREFASQQAIGQGRFGNVSLVKAREQVHIAFGFNGLTWGDSDRAALDVLTTVLGGHGGRLFRELRDKQSLAYTVSPLVSYGRHPGIVGAYIACAPEKGQRALASLQSEIYELMEHAPSDAEVERARNYIIGSHEMGLQKSDAQTSTMALMELYGYGYNDFMTYPKTIAKVTAADVLRVARRLFVPERAVSVSVGPEGQSEAVPNAVLC